MTRVIARVHPVHLMNVDWAPGGRQPPDQANRLGLWVRRKLAATVHVHHRHCYYYSQRPAIHVASFWYNNSGDVKSAFSPDQRDRPCQLLLNCCDAADSGVTSHRQPRQCRGGQGPKTVKGAQSDPNYVSRLLIDCVPVFHKIITQCNAVDCRFELA